MEIIVLLKPEEFAAFRSFQNGDALKQTNALRVIASNGADEERDACPMLFVRGRGIDAEVVALLKRRPEVNSVELSLETLTVSLQPEADSAPLVSLLVESGVEVTEVFRRDPQLEEMLRTLIEPQ